jgi:hypothetical protein
MRDVARAIEQMGREPINPVGSCFESSAFHLMIAEEIPKDTILCHGIGVSNFPGEEGAEIGHAWLEHEGKAYDTTWGLSTEADHYRENLKLSYVVTYTRKQAMDNWVRFDYPGPWDEKIKAITEKAGL